MYIQTLIESSYVLTTLKLDIKKYIILGLKLVDSSIATDVLQCFVYH